MAVAIFNQTSGIIDSTTLAARAALFQSNVMTAVERNFMVKNLRSEINVSFGSLLDMCVIVLGSLDASVTEIAAAMGDTSQSIEDGVEYTKGQAEVRLIWDYHVVRKDLQPLAETPVFNYTHQWKLPPKGIPVLKGRGLALYIFNMSPDDAFVNGPKVLTMQKIMGGWF